MTSRFILCLRLGSCVHWVSFYKQETTLFLGCESSFCLCSGSVGRYVLSIKLWRSLLTYNSFSNILLKCSLSIVSLYPRFPLPLFPPLHYGAVISTPAFSTNALWCHVFHSRVFHPCIMVPRFPLPRFPLPRIQRPRQRPHFVLGIGVRGIYKG